MRRVGVKERRGAGVVGLLGGSSLVALGKHQRAGYVPEHKKCIFCKWGNVSGPATRTDKQGGHLYYRGTAYGCNKSFNVFTGSIFESTKLTPAQVGVVVHAYSSPDKIAPPPVDDMAADAEAGRHAVERVVGAFRGVEVAVAKRQNSRASWSETSRWTRTGCVPSMSPSTTQHTPSM